MPSKVSARRQAKRERDAIRKLRDVGLLTGKIDLRKKPTKYQKSQLRKFADVISGKAAAIKPANPGAFKSVFRVKGDVVVIPKRPGEKITVKSGKVRSTRKTRRGTVKSEYITISKATRIARPKEPTQYAIPFNRGDHLEWMRHPSYDALKQFMGEYARYKGWRKYAIGEADPLLRENEMDFEDDEDLTVILEEKLGPQYGAGGGRYPGPRKARAAARKRKPRKRKARQGKARKRG